MFDEYFAVLNSVELNFKQTGYSNQVFSMEQTKKVVMSTAHNSQTVLRFLVRYFDKANLNA